MNGEQSSAGITPPETVPEEARQEFGKILEKQDFDATFSDVLYTIRPQLDRSFARSFGIRIKFYNDIEQRELDDDISYDHGYTLRKMTDRSNCSVVGVELRPGSLAINELVGALGEYGVDELQPTKGTLSHKMYSAGLITKAYLEAAISEIHDGVDPALRANADGVVNYLISPKQVKEQIDGSELTDKHRLSDLLEYLKPKNALDINRHRLAAGMYFEHFPEDKDLVVPAMRRALAAELPAMTELTFIEKHLENNLSVEHDNPFLALAQGESRESVDDIIDLNMLRASQIRQHLVAWAFPMEVNDYRGLYAMISEFSYD